MALFPQDVLRGSLNSPVMIEVKNGETYNGVLMSCDFRMNIVLKDAVCTSRDAEHFNRIKQCTIRGNMIRNIRVPDDTVSKAVQLVAAEQASGRGRPGNFRGGRGRGRGGSGRGRGDSGFPSKPGSK
ncbi:putative LSM domain protein [Blattamonas nauphoetae]|uniref:U6 snRNA-associated Sm-like protein LSm4 n=1 Tax=Blattamonas nauphoetae TaxID=2049346 RepID=A0ABQ9XXR7_9EUKA|nr:putative LSM domain protein [Blattamonas nauphoetae]